MSSSNPNRMHSQSLSRLSVAALCLLSAAPALAQPSVTSPRAQFGFDIGADYQLANYQQLVAYWKVLARQSQRVRLDTIGTTAEGRPMVMAIIT